MLTIVIWSEKYLFCWSELEITPQPLFLCPEIHPPTLSPTLDVSLKVSDAEDQPIWRHWRACIYRTCVGILLSELWKYRSTGWLLIFWLACRLYGAITAMSLALRPASVRTFMCSSTISTSPESQEKKHLKTCYLAVIYAASILAMREN